MPASIRGTRSPLAVSLLPLALLVALLAPAPHPAAASSTEVFNTGFESGLPPEFSAPGCVIEGVQGYAGLGTAGHTFAGSFLRYTSVPLHPTTLTLTGLPAHDAVDLDFLLGVIDSWDGTELLQVRVDGALLFNHWFQLALGDSSDYIAPPGVLLSRGVNLGFSNSSYHYRDRAYDFVNEPLFHSIPHSASTLTVEWGLSAISGPAASQWQGGSDESWAIDGVRVRVTNSTAGVAPGANDALSLAGAFPNPSAGGAMSIAFSLPGPMPARLEVLDVQGRRVFAREVGALGRGAHQVQVGSGTRLAPGVYTVRLTQGGRVRSARAVVLR
jgi:hypothetical protein